MKDKVLQVLDAVVHPETGSGLAEGGFVASVETSATGGEHIAAVLKFQRKKEPFAASLRRQAEAALAAAFPDAAISVTVETPRADPAPVPSRRLPGIGKIIAVASGKGGVGKSTVCARLATTLAAQGYRTGILDADIYGPSQPDLLGVTGYLPAAEPAEKTGCAPGTQPAELIIPAENKGVRIMSIGFFINPRDALMWRGPMATNALKQLIHQTGWGELDYLFVDLPPGTGDVHLTIAQELELDGAVIVSTPQRLAVADVRRGIEMFRSEGIGVPVLGLVENMAWFSPRELPENRYHIFGEGGTRRLAETEGIDFLGDIPIVMSGYPDQAPYYTDIARKIVDKLQGKC